MTNSNISRDEIRSAIEDKLCASFSVTSETATDDQIFQAAAIVVRELMSRFLAVENPKKHKKEVADFNLLETRAALTYFVRGERFCDGHMASCIEGGYLLKWLSRYRELLLEKK